MDIALLYTPNTIQSDIAVDGTDLLTGDVLQSGILMSLFSNRRANADDEVDGDDRMGWWADTYSDIARDKTGSRLWLLNRAKQTTQNLARAKIYCQEALKWIVDDKIGKSVEVETEYLRLHVLAIGVTVTRPDGRVLKFGKYEYVWSDI